MKNEIQDLARVDEEVKEVNACWEINANPKKREQKLANKAHELEVK